ncbi:hypothetical protein CYMTET_31851 [Cymbomonas tetramitiformis]|uniref:Tyrosinase copper-binding domain-containing protein n=1 Tax=Cymbomonas tetramitiformis TaxID=36881 RepID=A0AAE0BZR2_9CHLO|nr:hypothetical protein CYMTET_44583 [Cymbomonas tetramitiformis]KAK3259191.1 hypothetical protein CYMTET_31851 [Cymbomonas tetramitiformis]
MGGNFNPLNSAPGLDLSISPMDPTFMFMHANVERNFGTWQSHHSNLRSMNWTFPSYGFAALVPSDTESMGRYVTKEYYYGSGFEDLLSSSFGFTDRQLDIQAHQDPDELWTNADVMCRLDLFSGAAPYKYDTYSYNKLASNHPLEAMAVNERDYAIPLLVNVK